MNIINEGFTRKYVNEEFIKTLEKLVTKELKNSGYNVQAKGADKLIESAAKYIEEARYYVDDYSPEQWLKETEKNNPEELECLKKSREMKEKLEEEDYYNFNSDVYNALSDVMFKYRDKNVDEVDLDRALNRFADRFFEYDFEECLKECIKKLNEAEMSDEDKKDSEILWNIYTKTQNRANAKLTPEEKDVLDKYNLRRSGDLKNIIKKDANIYSQDTGPVVSNEIKRSAEKTSLSNINLADRARKLDVRGRGYEANRTFKDYDPSREYKDPETGKYVRLKDKGLLDRERSLENQRMQEPVNQMKYDLRDKKYHQKELNNLDARYDNEIEKLKKQLADMERRRESSRDYNQRQLDRAEDRINKLLKKDR